MRDIDFLPAWYGKLHQRYRSLILQAWVSVGLLVVLVSYCVTKKFQIKTAKATTAQCEMQISQSQRQLVQLGEKIKYESQLRQEAQIVARLGVGVDTTRLLKAIEDAMTPEMGLTDLSLETIEQPRGAFTLLSTKRAGASSDGDLPAQVDRRLHVVIDGVAPTDTASATFLARLLKVDCFESVNLEYMRPGRSRDGHVTREFEVTFDLNLNAPAEGRS